MKILWLINSPSDVLSSLNSFVEFLVWHASYKLHYDIVTLDYGILF